MGGRRRRGVESRRNVARASFTRGAFPLLHWARLRQKTELTGGTPVLHGMALSRLSKIAGRDRQALGVRGLRRSRPLLKNQDALTSLHRSVGRSLFLITDTGHREKRENMRRIIVIDNDHGRPAKSHLVAISHWIFLTISHFNEEWNALLNGCLDLLSRHRIET